MAIDTLTYVIAEAGVNHNGSLDLALRLIDVAAAAGADAIKFQTFQAAALVGRHAPKADYQRRTTSPHESQLDMIRRLELGPEMHEALIERAKDRGIDFLSTPFDIPSLEMLTDVFRLKTIKLSSGEITNAPFLVEVGRRAQHVILSTGMSSIGEVEAALGALAYGFGTDANVPPGHEAFRKAFASDVGQMALRDRVKLLHCTTEYPAPFGDVNLRAMDALETAFRLPVGYSDHTPGIHVAIAAVARGARLIEKHVTLDRTLPGPDHRASLEPGELTKMISAIRDVEEALGDGVKRPASSEWKNLLVARKSVVASRTIKTGDVFSADNLALKRPGSGCSPFRYWELIGRVALRSYEIDEPIDG
jgi:N-acetylneuraminate synthase